MEITLAGGIVVDVATRDDVVGHHHRLEQLLARPQARARILSAGVQTAASVVNAPKLSLQRPPAGALWVVQWARTQGNDPGTAVANVNMVGYIGSSAIAGSVLAGAGGTGGEDSNAFTNPLAVPSLTAFPDKVVCYPNQELYFLVLGTAVNIGANAQYKLTIGVLEVLNTPEALTWI